MYDPFPDLINTGLSNGIENDSSVNNNQVVILPKTNPSYPLSCTGDWLNFACRIYAKPGATDQQFMDDWFPRQYTSVDYVAVRSQDQGRTWNSTATIVVPAFNPYEVYTGGYTYDGAGNITGGVGGLMRNDQTIPSYNANPQNGFLYVTYQSSAFQASKLQQIGLTTSRDGGKTWSTPVQVSRTPAASPNPQAFQTCVAVTKAAALACCTLTFATTINLIQIKRSWTLGWPSIKKWLIHMEAARTLAWTLSKKFVFHKLPTLRKMVQTQPPVT